MKKLIVMAALLTSGAAVAQTHSTTTTTTHTTTTASVPTTGEVVAPSNSNPELDARGIPVISDPAVVPPGWNSGPAVGGPAVDPAAPATTMPSTDSYPPCSRTVTDNCVQTYERGRSPR